MGRGSFEWDDRAALPSNFYKGHVVSFILDAHIRRVTNGRKSMDDVMRLALVRYGSERGFTARELRATVEENMLAPPARGATGRAGRLHA